MTANSNMAPVDTGVSSSFKDLSGVICSSLCLALAGLTALALLLGAAAETPLTSMGAGLLMIAI